MAIQETPEFAKEADRILGRVQHDELLTFLGMNPTAGVVVPGTGGLRKVRWAIPGRGKRGGARVIYYFHNESVPLLALDLYAKNEQEEITADQKKRFRLIVDAFTKGKGNKR